MSWIDIPAGSGYGLNNLPFGLGAAGGAAPTVWVAVGEMALDLAQVDWPATDVPAGCFERPTLKPFLSAGPTTWSAVRDRLAELLTDPAAEERLAPHLVARRDLVMSVPVQPTDYVDFFSSIHHATNMGKLFRPDTEPLLPNWRTIPIGYHGRTGTLLPDGAEIRRPSGYRTADGVARPGPTQKLDIELEVGTVVGVGSEIGSPVPIEEAGRHLFGMCLVNDWSARDIQAYEYQPLGPFLGKSFATSVSPWLISFQALEPFRVASPAQDPTPADYLQTEEPWAFELDLEIWLETSEMRAGGADPIRISAGSFADMYWTPAQQLAHLTVNGASVNSGDLFGSGTVSGPSRGSEGCLMELTWNGAEPIELPDGNTRSFLEDGDRVELRGYAGEGPDRLSLGSVSGIIVS